MRVRGVRRMASMLERDAVPRGRGEAALIHCKNDCGDCGAGGRHFSDYSAEGGGGGKSYKQGTGDSKAEDLVRKGTTKKARIRGFAKQI